MGMNSLLNLVLWHQSTSTNSLFELGMKANIVINSEILATLTNQFKINSMSSTTKKLHQLQLTNFYNNLNSNKMFKYIFFLLWAIPFLTSCGGNDTKQREVAKPKTTVVLLYDISTSNDEFALLNENHLATIFQSIANKGGGKFYSFLIKSDSRKQEVFEYDIPSLDTLELKGNQYQIKKRAKKNEEAKANLLTTLSDFVSKAKAKIILPKTEPFTDLVNALALAKTTLEQPNIASTNTNLLIISDGINDLPPVDGLDKMEAVDFPNTNVVLVRPTTKGFINGQPTLTNSINDCILNIK